MEKSDAKTATSRLNIADSPESETSERNNLPDWQPGYRARFPGLGVGALVAAFICACAAIAVLVSSNGVSSSQWPDKLAPNVCLGAINAVGNLMLAIAISQGVAIAWWRKAMKGATVAELHRSWTYSMSAGSILQHFWSVDAIALAALAAKFAIVDGILFQRATSTYIEQDPPKAINMLGVAATNFPETGYVVSNGSAGQTSCDCFMIGDSYTPVVNTWETSNGFFKGYHNYFQTCNGICFTHIDAIGFDIDCNTTVDDHSDIAKPAVAAWGANKNGTTGNSSQWSDLAIFNTTFGLQGPSASRNYSILTFDLLYFVSANPEAANPDSCPGTMTSVSCKLRPALIRYPVTVMNETNNHITNGVNLGYNLSISDTINSISAPPKYFSSLKQAKGFQVLSPIDPQETLQNISSITHLGGIANALSQFLTSAASITYTGGSVWALAEKGTLAQTMMFGPPNMGSCDCSFHDALDTLVAAINQLTFLTAVGLVDSTSFVSPVNLNTSATVEGVMKNSTTKFRSLPETTLQITDMIHYRTHYLFMGLAIASMICCILLIVPSFWRYGELGRDVTLGPIEIASAFGAPMLESNEGKGGMGQLMEQVGNQKVMYGFVDVNGEGNSQGQRQSVRLAMEEPTRVRPVSGVWSPPTSPQVGTSPRLGTRS